jgi:APA family basic amino acid/polyamine antiporter
MRRREPTSGISAPDGFRAPWHPWTTGLFILACVVVIGCSFWAYPIDSLIGYGILLLGVPPYLYWRRQKPPESSPQ